MILDLPLAELLATWRPGSQGPDWTWDQEHDDLVDRDRDHIARDVALWWAGAPVEEPLLGSDGRVWDGHHRIVSAAIAGVEGVRCLLTDPGPGNPPERWSLEWRPDGHGPQITARYHGVDATIVDFGPGPGPGQDWTLVAARVVLASAAEHHNLTIDPGTPARFAATFPPAAAGGGFELSQFDVVAWHTRDRLRARHRTRRLGAEA